MSENPNEIDMQTLALQMGVKTPAKGNGPVPQGSDDLQAKLDKLTEKYDKLYSLSRAVWELLREKTDLEEEDLVTRLGMVEANQNLVTKPKAELCPECDRPLQRIEGKHNKCIYCGYIQEFKSPFDKLL